MKKTKKTMLKIFEINLYDSIDERQYVQAETEEEAIVFFIKNCVFDKEDQNRYLKEYNEGNTENIYIEQIEIYNTKRERENKNESKN